MPGLLDKLLKEKPKAPSEVVTKLVAAFDGLGKSDKSAEQVSKYLGYAKVLLFGDEEHEAVKENAVQLAVEAANTDLLTLFVRNLHQLDFEARKDTAQVYGALVRIKDANDNMPGAAYVRAHPELLDTLFNG